MKFLIDNNLSYKLTKLLKPTGIDAPHIKNRLSIFSLDHEIWEFAKEYDVGNRKGAKSAKFTCDELVRI